MNVKVLLFATLRDRAGSKSLELEISEAMNVGDLKRRIAADFPALKESMESVLVAINREYAFDEGLIPTNAEIAMFPPVSGG
jgi:molybdopterin synthase catalytic subunit